MIGFSDFRITKMPLNHRAGHFPGPGLHIGKEARLGHHAVVGSYAVLSRSVPA